MNEALGECAPLCTRGQRLCVHQLHVRGGSESEAVESPRLACEREGENARVALEGGRLGARAGRAAALSTSAAATRSAGVVTSRNAMCCLIVFPSCSLCAV